MESRSYEVESDVARKLSLGDVVVDLPPSAQMMLATVMVVLFASLIQLARRPGFPTSAPKLFQRDNWPIVGMLWRFYGRRNDFMVEGTKLYSSGNFSFYLGKHRVIGVSGQQSRRAVYESRDLNLAAG